MKPLNLYKHIIILLAVLFSIFTISCSSTSTPTTVSETKLPETTQVPTTTVAKTTTTTTQANQTVETSIKYPESTGLVNDFAGIFTEEEKSEMENFLKEFLEEEDIAIAVVSVNSLEGLTIEKYAYELFNTWHIGTKTNDGILLLVAPKERMLRIELGISMEDEITNDSAKRIIDETIIPYFKESKMGQGCYEGVKAIAETILSSQ